MNRLNHNVFEDSDCEDYRYSKPKVNDGLVRIIVTTFVAVVVIAGVIAAIKNVG